MAALLVIAHGIAARLLLSAASLLSDGLVTIRSSS
jgi:hypothetical protein